MRLYNIYYLCKVSIEGVQGLDFRKNDYQNGQSDITVLGWQKAVQSYDVVSEIDFLQTEAKALLASVPTYANIEEDPRISIATYNAVRSWNYQLLTKMQAIVDLHEALDTGESQAGIDIKIPKCDSFKEYIQYMKDIDFVFNQCPLISQSKEEIVFNTVDVGPMWLSFIIKAKENQNFILNTLSKMAEIAMKVKSNWVVVNQQEAILKRLQKSNEIKEEFVEGFKKLKNTMLDESVTELETACGAKVDNPEDRDRAARSIEVYAQLIEKGVELYCSIDTPEEIKVEFPFTKNAPVIPQGLQNLIEAKENAESAEKEKTADNTASVSDVGQGQPVDSVPPVQPVSASEPVEAVNVPVVPGAGAAPAAGDVQDIGNMLNLGNAQPAGNAQNPGNAQPAGNMQNQGNAQPAGNMKNPGNAQPAGNTQNTKPAEGAPAAGDVQDIGSMLNLGNAQPTGNTQNQGNAQSAGNAQNPKPAEGAPAAGDVQDIGSMLNLGNTAQPAGGAKPAEKAVSAGEIQDVGSMLNLGNAQPGRSAKPAGGVQDVGNMLNLGNTSTAEGAKPAENAKPAQQDAAKPGEEEEIIDVLKFI